MKHIYTKKSIHSSFSFIHKPWQQCLLLLVVFLSFGVGNVWGAENDTHDFSQSLSQLLNNNASISSINIDAPSYPIKEVIISFRYNKSIENAVTMTVSVGGTSWGSKYSAGTGNNYADSSFTHASASGAIAISFTNNTGSGTGHGTFYVNNVRLVEGTSAPAVAHTVTYNVGTGSCKASEKEASAGAGVTLPTPTMSCDGWSFAGWTTGALVTSETSVTPDPLYTGGSTYKPAADITLYAVYQKGDGKYHLVTTLPTGDDIPGNYMVVNTSSAKAMDAYIKSTYYLDADATGTITSNAITPANVSYFSYNHWKVTYESSKWIFYNEYTSKYLYNYCNDGTHHNLGINESKPSGYTLSLSSGYAIFNSADDTGASIVYDGSYTEFKGTTTASTTAATGVHLYKEDPLTYYSNPSCCTALGQVSGTLDASTPTSATLTWSPVTGAEKYQVKVVGSSSHNDWTDAVSGVTVTGLTCGTSYTAYLRAIDTNGSHCSTGPESTVSIPASSWTVTSTGVTNVTPASAFPTTTCSGFSITSMTANDGYLLPSSITITNADHTWNSSTGALTVSNVSGNVVITITGEVAANFTNGATVFIQAESSSAWDASACVKAWFNASGSGGAAQTTYWLFDATGDDSGKKLFATVVPASGDLNQVTLQRFASNCSDFYNNNGTLTKASAGGSNTFRTTGSGNSNVAWNGSGVTIALHGDPSDDDWASSLASFSDQGAGVWTATYENYAPANAAGESQNFKAKTNYNGWIGNTNSNSNATLSGMHVGSTYNITATLDVTDHSLVMSKTFVKGTVSFDLQGHGSAIDALTNVTANSKISAPTAPSETGWDFGGWYKEPACTNAWTFASDQVTETMTLYAKWTKHNYTITSTLSNVSSSPTIPSSYEYTGSAASLSYTISPSSGYRLPTTITVSGTTYTWNSSTGALALTGTITSDVTITITAVQTHIVTWLSNGSNHVSPVTYDHGGTLAFPASDPSAPSSCSDKVFVGWTSDDEITAETSTRPTIISAGGAVNADATYRAVFADEEDGGTTTILSEPFTDFSSGSPTAPGSTYATVLDGSSMTYTCTAGSCSGTTATNIQTTGGPDDGNNILIRKSNGSFAINNIPANGKTSATLTYKWRGSGTMSLTGSSNISLGSISTSTDDNGNKSCTVTITINSGTTYSLTWENTSSSDNIRFDLPTITCSGTSYDNYITQCCALKPVTNLAVSETTVNSATLTWTAPSPTTGIDHLELRNASTDAQIGSNIAVGTTTATVSGLTECTTYTYKVVSVGASCETPSEAVEGTPYSGAKTVTYTFHDDVTANGSFTTDCTHSSTTLLNPTRTGYTFNGWYDAVSGGTKIGNGGASYTPSATITLHAQWSLTNYTVTMTQSPSAGATLSGGTTTANYGGTINISTDVPSNYRFDGWTSSPSVTFADASATSTSFSMPASNVTVTANFVQIHTLTFTIPSGGGSAVTPPATADHGGTVTLPSTTGKSSEYSCETFLGWTTTAPNGSGTWATTPSYKAAGAMSDAINANTTFYAVYSRSGGGASGTVELTGANIGTFYTSHTELQSNGNIAYGNSRSITVGDYTWTTNGFQQGAQTSDYYLNLRERTNAGGVSWLQIPTMPGDINSITFSVTNGGSNSTTNVLYFQSGTTSNETVIATSENTDSKSRTLTISGSYTGGYITANGTIRIRSLTVSYGPAPIVSHTLECGCAIAQFDLTYNANTTYFPGSTTSCSGEDDYVFASHDDEYTICSTEPTLDGYKFTGWTTNANGSGDHFDAGEVVSCMPSADVTLYAQYERVYTVTFNNQGSTTPVTQGSYGAAIDVPNATTPCNDPADPDTYTWAFVGWSKTAIAPMSFLPTLEIEAGTETYTPEEDLTLYAIYRKTTTSDAFVAGASGAYKIKATSSGTDYYAAGYSSTKINATTTSGDAVTYYIRYNSVGSNYTIQQADGKYIAYKGNTPSGSNPDLKLSDDAFYWSISSAGGGLWAIQSPTSTDANTRYLQLSAGTGFKAYTDDVNPTFVAAEASFYYHTMSCASDFDITFQTGDWTINWAVGHPEASYKHLADATEVSTFPTASYNGWTFLGWRVSEYAGSISAPDGASIYGGSNGTSGNTYTIASTDVVMYPVFTQFLDNAPFDTIYGGNYYIYYIADGDISTSQDVYGANNRIYASGRSNNAYEVTSNCNDAALFTFTKLPNGKWTIYDNKNSGSGGAHYVCGEQTGSGNDLTLQQTATAANYGEWTITVLTGNQVIATCFDNYIIQANTTNATSGSIKNYAANNYSSDPSHYHRVYLGTCTERIFTTDPVRNATITINGNVKVTSTASKAIKSTSVLSVTANNIDETTLSVSSNNSHFTVNPSSITVTNHQVAATSVTITYTPAADATTDGTEDATITVSDGAGTSENVTVTGRHLPAEFVIAAKGSDGKWYALPADCTTSDVWAGVLIEVDNASDPTRATAAAPNTKFGLREVASGRYAANGSHVTFTERLSTATANDQKTLYNGADTKIQVNAMWKGYAATNPEKYEWIPSTDDLKDYTLTSTDGSNSRPLCLSTSGTFGTYLSGAAYGGKVRLLPATFYDAAPMQVLEWKANSVVVMYNGTETSATTQVGDNSASSSQTLSTRKLTHGVYELATDQALTSNDGKSLTVNFGSSKAIVDIPVIITGNANASDGHSTQDVVIVKDGKLTAQSTKYSYHNIYVYGGGKLDIPTGTQLGVNNLILRAGGLTTSGIGTSPSATYDYVYPQVKIAGSWSNTKQTILYEYITDYDHWYHLCLPFNGTLSTITYPQEYYGDNVTADNTGSWIIKRYAGEIRATGENNAWVDIESESATTVTAGHGYIFWAAPKKVTIGGDKQRQKWGIQRITMSTTAGAATTAETANKTIDGLGSYSGVDNNSGMNNDQGWNLIGNPYMANLTGLNSTSLQVGQLVHSNTNPWDGRWEWDNTNPEAGGLRYVTIPDDHFDNYTAQTMSWFTDSNPMVAGRTFFVQIAGANTGVLFATANRASLAPAWQRNAEAEQVVDIETGIVMSGAEWNDEVNFWIKDDKTEAYEFNADYPKTPNTTNFNIYGVHPSGNLSWVALSPPLAERDMPIGYQVPQAGDYILSLSEKFNMGDVESVLVTDHGVTPELTTDLMINSYLFTVHQAETNNERFTVSIKVREREDVTTGVDGAAADSRAQKFIYHDKMYILNHGILYDATGKRVTRINK